jgi:hypothetical protein
MNGTVPEIVECRWMMPDSEGVNSLSTLTGVSSLFSDSESRMPDLDFGDGAHRPPRRPSALHDPCHRECHDDQARPRRRTRRMAQIANHPRNRAVGSRKCLSRRMDRNLDLLQSSMLPRKRERGRAANKLGNRTNKVHRRDDSG